MFFQKLFEIIGFILLLFCLYYFSIGYLVFSFCLMILAYTILGINGIIEHNIVWW